MRITRQTQIVRYVCIGNNAATYFSLFHEIMTSELMTNVTFLYPNISDHITMLACNEQKALLCFQGQLEYNIHSIWYKRTNVGQGHGAMNIFVFITLRQLQFRELFAIQCGFRKVEYC